MTNAFESKSAALPDYLLDEAALFKFVRNWEECNLPATAWTHSAHVTAASSYAFDYPAEECYQRMKEGILRFNACTGVENTPDRGYHETLTRFWSELVAAFVRSHHETTGGKSSRLDVVRAAVAEFDERDLWKRYYSFDVLRNREARRAWIPPDLNS